MSSPLTTMITGRCPHCEKASIYSNVLSVRERCEVCGVVYKREDGNWTGAPVMAYVGTSVYLCVFLAWAWATGRLSEPGFEWTALISTSIVSLLLLRFAQGLWLGMLYDWGYIYEDEPDNDE